MANLQAILQYQEADKKLYALERELAGCDERKEYVKAKKFMESAPEKLDSLDAKAAALKAEALDLSKKYRQAEETLKDFENLDELVQEGADIAFYKKNAQAIMDKLKKLKGELNALIANINATSAEYQELKKQVIAMQKQYAAAKEKYNAVKQSRDEERKQLEEELSKIATEIDGAVLAKYQTKRKERIFPVVVELVQGRCAHCGMEPPLTALNALTGGGTIECDNCHRIIYKK